MTAVSRILSLATGTLPDISPPEVVRAAAAAGFSHTGIWFDPETWTNATTRAVRAALEETGLKLLDLEVIWINPGMHDPNHDRAIATAGELGAQNVLVVSSEPDEAKAKTRFERICALCDEAGAYAALEFLPITEVRTLHDALAILRSVDHPAGKLLIDPLHLARSGGHPIDLREVPEVLFSYAQFCDAPAMNPDMSYDSILAEAIDGRLQPGEGDLPLSELLGTLPKDLPLALEMRSKALRDQYPDPVARARVVLTGAQAYLSGVPRIEHIERTANEAGAA